LANPESAEKSGTAEEPGTAEQPGGAGVTGTAEGSWEAAASRLLLHK
jgi:hypothetical protein